MFGQAASALLLAVLLVAQGVVRHLRDLAGLVVFGLSRGGVDHLDERVVRRGLVEGDDCDARGDENADVDGEERAACRETVRCSGHDSPLKRMVLGVLQLYKL